MIGKFLNAAGYQAVWFASVAGASQGLAWVGPVAAVAFACAVIGTSARPGADARLIPFALAIGAVADSAWILLGWLDYRAPWPSASFAPAWILGLWLSLALTLNHSLAFLRGRPVLAVALGALGGPLAYWAASQSGAVRLDAPAPLVLCGLGLAWGLLFPALVRVASRKSAWGDRVDVPQASS